MPGPAGLTATIYLARFHLNVLVVDRGHGRTRFIPRTHNHAAFPEGIRGGELVDRMAEQARGFGAVIRDGEATALHDAAIAENLLRYCPVCDGYDVTDCRVGLIGSGDHGAREALFVRSFTRDVTLIAPDGAHQFSDDDHAELQKAGVALIDGPVRGYAIEERNILAVTAAGALRFDVIYPALGSTIHSDLARAIGADVSDLGCTKVDAPQRTSVAGLYAAGDVVLGLDQISHAMGEAGVAATAIRNDLNAHKPLYR